MVFTPIKLCDMFDWLRKVVGYLTAVRRLQCFLSIQENLN